MHRRRRLAVGLATLGVLLATAQTGFALGSSSPGASGRHPAVVSYTVRPGDSLWSIARRADPHGDPRALVDELSQARHGAPLAPGEVITWPR
jgi:hypothetical protein